MQLRRYLRILLSRKWLIILTADVALLVAALISVRTPPVYSATAAVRVAEGAGGGTSYNDVNYAERVVQTYVHLLTSRPYLEAAISRLNLPLTPDELARSVKVDTLPNTELITIGVDSHNPAEAAALANSLANQLVEQGDKVYSGQGKSAQQILQEQLNAVGEQLNRDRALLAGLSGGANLQGGSGATAPGAPTTSDAQNLAARIDAEQRTYATLLDQYDHARVNEAILANSVSVVDPAVAPGAASKPRILVNIVLGALLGILGGIALAFLFENLNPRVHAPEDLAQDPTAGLPILGRIPALRRRILPFGSRAREKVLVMRDGSGSTGTAEAFRRLNSAVLSLAGRDNLRQVLFVPLETGSEGPSRYVQVNLAVAAAEAGKQVVLVDADLQAPSLHGFFGLKPGPGLAEVIGQPEQLRASLYQTGVRGLRLLPAGGYVVDPTRVLAAASLESIVAQLSELADIVFWNCPAPGASAEASRLGPVLDGVVLIIRQGVTTTASLDLVMAELRQIGARPLGVIYQGASVPEGGTRRQGRAASVTPARVATPGESELELEAPHGQPRQAPVHTSGGAVASAGQAESSVVMSSQAPRGSRSDSANHNLTR